MSYITVTLMTFDKQSNRSRIVDVTTVLATTIADDFFSVKQAAVEFTFCQSPTPRKYRNRIAEF